MLASTCQYSLGLVARTPTFALAGYSRCRGRRQPPSRISYAHVEAEAYTLNFPFFQSL
jgi:hypothetical protein